MITEKPDLSPKALNKRFKLNSDKLAKFCLEYVKDLNGTQAAIRATYSKKTARVIAARKLALVNVQECIAYLQDLENKKADSYNAQDLRKDLVAMKNMSVGDIFDDEWKLKPLSQWSDVWLQNISSIDVSQLGSLSDAKNDKDRLEIIKKIKWPDKIRVIELLGKHIDIQAWREQHQIESSTLGDRLKRARDRKERDSNK